LKIAFVTGSYGFVGRHVARRLAEEGFAVEGLGHGGWGLGESRAWGLSTWHTADVTVDSLVTYAGKPNIIIHCAGSGSVGYSITNPYQDFQRTVATTMAVLEFIRLHQPEASLVIPSSAGVYGVVESPSIHLDQPLAPISPYGVHKQIVENLCQFYARHFGIRCAIVRLFSVYGTGLRKQLLWDACKKLSSGDFDFAGTGQEIRDWLNIEDAANLLSLAARKADPKCPIVNGGSGAGVMVRQAVEWIAEALGCERPPSFSGHARAGDPIRLVADIAETRAWGWKPEHNLRDDISGYVDWFARGAP
jgi:UDP-glucose 4-epimerase